MQNVDVRLCAIVCYCVILCILITYVSDLKKSASQAHPLEVCHVWHRKWPTSLHGGHQPVPFGSGDSVWISLFERKNIPKRIQTQLIISSCFCWLLWLIYNKHQQSHVLGPKKLNWLNHFWNPMAHGLEPRWVNVPRLELHNGRDGATTSRLRSCHFFPSLQNFGHFQARCFGRYRTAFSLFSLEQCHSKTIVTQGTAYTTVRALAKNQEDGRDRCKNLELGWTGQLHSSKGYCCNEQYN